LSGARLLTAWTNIMRVLEMLEKPRRNVGWVIISRLVGLFVFLVLLAVANALAPASGNSALREIVVFFDSQLLALLAMTFLFMLGDAFSALVFPFDLAAPPLSAAGWAVLAFFLFQMFSLVDALAGTALYAPFQLIAAAAYPLVFALALFFGYAAIFARILGVFGRGGDREQEGRERRREEVKGSTKDERAERRRKRKEEWGDIGDELRGTILDALRKARREMNEEKK
jgi:hypothetical protein